MLDCAIIVSKNKGVPQQAEVALGVPGRLRPRIFLMFGTSALGTGRLYSRRNPWYTISGAESAPGHMVPSGTAKEKNPQLHHRESISGPSD